LEFVTTSDNPEIEIEVVKGKGRDKETEVVNLEDLIDVKGWKALGNRLSQYKVTKVKPVEEPEDSGLEEGDDENELMETTESEKLQSSKKKEHQAGEPSFAQTPEGEQASLFAESKSPSFAEAPEGKQSQPLVNGQPPKPKSAKPKKPEQATLFNEEEKSRKEEKLKKDNKGFSAGETIELEL
jgi:topoisomerase-4 subunit A